MADRNPRVTDTLYLGATPPSDEELNPFAVRIGPAGRRATGKKTMAKSKGDTRRDLKARVGPGEGGISADGRGYIRRAEDALMRAVPEIAPAVRGVEAVFQPADLEDAMARGFRQVFRGDAYVDPDTGRSLGELQNEDALLLALMGGAEMLPFAAKPLKAVGRGAARVGRAITPRAVREGVSDLAARARRYLTEARPLDEARPAYERVAEGPFTVIQREGLQPEMIPEAQDETSLAALRRMAQDRSRSPAIRAADEASMEARGAPYDTEAPMPVSSLARQAAMGRAYREAVSDSPAYKHALFEQYGAVMPQVVEQAKAQNLDQLTEAAYRKLGSEVASQFDTLPLKLRYHSGEGEYPSSTAMIQDALGRGRLNVFSGGEPHEFLSAVDPATGLSQNEMFRAVHDYFGHVVPGSRFGPSGEEIAYAAHSQQLSPLAQLALLSETRGQNSLVNFSPLNADLTLEMNTLRRQRKERSIAEHFAARGDADASSALDRLPTQEEIDARLAELGSQTQYAPQRAVLLPPEFLPPMAPGGTPDWLRSILSPEQAVSARGVHISGVPGLSATDPSFYGTGHRGAEYKHTKRVLPDRTYYYSGPEGTVTPEDSVMGMIGGELRRGPRFAYEADLSGLYDLQADPEGLVRLAKAYNLPGYEPTIPYWMAASKDGLEGQSAIPDLERLVRDYGYSGYLTDMGSQRAAALYEPVAGLRPIERGPQGYAEGGAVQTEGKSA